MFFLSHRNIPVPPSVKNVKKNIMAAASVSPNHWWPQASVATSDAVRYISLTHGVTITELVTLPATTQDRRN